MRIIVRVLAVLLVVGVVLGIGSAVYNTGVNVGMAAGADVAAGPGDPVAPYAFGYGYGPGPHWHGPGFFGIFAWILGFILIIFAVRAAVGWGSGGPGAHGGWSSRRERLEELHRELHRTDGGAGDRSATT